MSDPNDVLTYLFRTTSNTLTIPFTPTSLQLLDLQKDHPVTNQNFNGKHHPHLPLHIDRYAQEQRILTNIGPTSNYIHDVGGASGRHRKYGRHHVWSTQPLIMPQDHFRTQYPESSCRHLGQSCDCQDFDVAMFVHSLYYIQPADIITIINNTNMKTAFAVVHMFEKNNGSFTCDDKYVVKGQYVTMTVNGNTTPYQHNNMRWLRCGISVQGEWLLVWKQITKSSHSTIFQFRTVARTMGHTIESVPETANNYVVVSAQAVQVRGIAPFQWRQKYTAVASIPTDIYSTLQLYVSGKARDSKLFDMLAYKSMTLLRDKGIVGEEAAKMQLVLVYNLMSIDDNLEMHLLQQLLTADNIRSKFNSMLTLINPTGKVTNKIPAIMAIGALLYVTARNPTNVNSYILPAGLMLSALITRLTQNDNNIIDVNPKFTSIEANNNDKAETINHVECQLPPKEITSLATMTVDRMQSKPVVGTSAPVGTVINNSVPVVYGQSQNNAVAALTHRGLITTSEPTPPVIKSLRDYVMLHFEELFRGREQVFANYDEWNKRYPTALQKLHNEARKEYRGEVKTKRKSFVKVEKLLLNVNHELTDKAPRLIQGADSTYNVLVGPWIYSFTKELARIWNANHHIFYTTGVLGDAIGAWINPDHYFLENDYSKFDASIGPALLKLELDIYVRFGMNKRLHTLMSTAIDKTGSTSTGINYSVVGTRPSGDQNTSCGNTLLNGVIMAWALSRQSITQYKMAVLGDDNLVCFHCSLSLTCLNKDIMSLGLNPKAVLKTNVNLVEYCSARFWPTESGRVLGPKIGRFLTKIGWMINPPASEKKKLQQYRGTIMSHLTTTGHVPVCNELITSTLEKLTEKRYIKDNEKRLVNSKRYTYCDLTWLMIHDLYGLTKATIDEITSMVESAPLGHFVKHPALEIICAIDC